jgi:hypothetical protein
MGLLQGTKAMKQLFHGQAQRQTREEWIKGNRRKFWKIPAPN